MKGNLKNNNSQYWLALAQEMRNSFYNYPSYLNNKQALT